MMEDKIIYLLSDSQLDSLVVNDVYNNLKGVEGVVLVGEENKRTRVGKQVKRPSQRLGVDYIWGQQLKTLNNLEDCRNVENGC